MFRNDYGPIEDISVVSIRKLDQSSHFPENVRAFVFLRMKTVEMSSMGQKHFDASCNGVFVIHVFLTFYFEIKLPHVCSMHVLLWRVPKSREKNVKFRSSP